MKKLFFMLITAVMLSAGMSKAQEAWVQIEALPTLSKAEERARAWAAAFPNISGYRLASGWYAVALGPYSAEQAENQLFALQTEGLIPADSFLSDGQEFTSRFWPVGAGAVVPTTPQETEIITQNEEEQIIIIAPEATPLPDETPREARQSEAELTTDQRKDLQIALQWFGHYKSAIDGAFGRGTRGSMAAWQQENGYEGTGILTTRQRAALLEAYRGELDALGLGRVVENKAGIELEMPIKLVEFDDYAPPFVRYREKNGSGVQVLLISQEGTQATLGGLYDVMQTLEIVPMEGLREREGNSFILTGQNADIHSYTYARLDDGMVKGFTVVYPPEADARMQKAIGIMRDTLKSIGPALDPTLGAQEAAQARDLLSGLEIRQPERTRSGVYVDPQGSVLTVAEAVKGCARITLEDQHDATLVAEDRASGLALLRPKSPLAPLGVARLSNQDPRIGGNAAVAGFPFGSALPAATLTFGKIEDVSGLSGERDLFRISADTEEGDIGGPVLDAAGQLAGILLPKPQNGTRQLPAGVRFAAKSETASDFLVNQGVPLISTPTGGALAPEDLTKAATDMTVLVSCWN